ncbi:CPBP family intramembrane metalloprotease [Halorubellus sp. JP-L1]|uniref:CPBP family intramembrane glutamic endopeptidase n=1 Tax=Halorubellus sp. JP-L1 TaxID=2715753 RepID=UPI0014089039|nr:CPBP family intramembrane glutamic endopeptidase [Halorubellus sp. JP-L1]NHN41285.1 CPBP family intramembrane metalloprotease [Halorubellus sp. JP-L1]
MEQTHDSSGRLARFVDSHPVVAFFAVAFAYSWAVFGVLFAAVGSETLGDSRLWQIPFAWGPLAGALVVGHVRHGDARTWLESVADPRTGLRWYALAAVVAFLYADAGHVAAALAGVAVTPLPLEDVAFDFAVTLAVAGSIEEFGWRGFAQPHLQERYDALRGAIVVGVAVGIWHYPWLLLAGEGYEEAGIGALLALPFLMVLMAVIFAWLFNGSGGAIPVVMLGHAVFNATPAFEFVADGPGWAAALGLLVWLGLLVGLPLVFGREYLAPRSPGTLFSGKES